MQGHIYYRPAVAALIGGTLAGAGELAYEIVIADAQILGIWSL